MSYVGEVANPGLLRPPVIYFAAALLGATAHCLYPLALPFESAGPTPGVVVLLLAIGLLAHTLHSFHKAQTPFPGNQAVRHLIYDGPFRFSRNPAYVAFSAIVLSIALLANSVWIVITLICAIAVINQLVIPREERYLAELFDESYIDYMKQVRRWC